MKDQDILTLFLGAGTLWLLNRHYSNSESPQVGRLPLPQSIGKVVDGPKKKFGSRADLYWGGLSGPAEVKAMTDRFRLHSLEWGNWVNLGMRETKFIELQEALVNLAKVMNVPQRNIGFDKKMSLSYGSRGRGGRALAAYYPFIHHINLTKESGDGSLAHEYGHAIDYFAGRNLGGPPSGGKNKSFKINIDSRSSGVPLLFEKLYQALYYNANGTLTSFAKHIKTLPAYWMQRNEVWARTFEAWVLWQSKKKGLKSRMLTSSSYNAAVYPSNALLQKVDPLIRRIITEVIGR